MRPPCRTSLPTVQPTQLPARHSHPHWHDRFVKCPKCVNPKVGSTELSHQPINQQDSAHTIPRTVVRKSEAVLWFSNGKTAEGAILRALLNSITDPIMRRRTTPSPMQLQILELIEDSVRQTGVAPSIREIGDQVGLKSPTSVQQHLTTLERLGLIARSEGKARAIQLRSPPKANRGLPFVGNIAAGRAIAAIQQDERVDLASLFDESKHMV